MSEYIIEFKTQLRAVGDNEGEAMAVAIKALEALMIEKGVNKIFDLDIEQVN